MKKCPKCGTQFEDEMSFCLQDGTRLAALGDRPDTEAVTKSYEFPINTKVQPGEAITEEWTGQPVSSETVMKPPAAENKFPARPQNMPAESQKSKAGFFLGALAGIGLLLIGTAIGGVFWYFGVKRANQIAAVNTSTVANTNAINVNSPGGLSDLEPNQDPTPSEINSSEIVNSKSSPTPVANPGETRTPDKTPVPEPKPTAKPGNDEIALPTPKPKDDRPPRIVSGGVINGKALSLPQPPYPAAARAVNAKGSVNVQVLVDEDGNVVSANAVSGHPLLRNSSEQAARRAKFRPTVLAGQAVKVTGVITYVFN